MLVETVGERRMTLFFDSHCIRHRQNGPDKTPRYPGTAIVTWTSSTDTFQGKQHTKKPSTLFSTLLTNYGIKSE